MTTTAVQLATNAISHRYVVAIEGYKRLLTNASSAQAEAAWVSTDRAGLGTTHVTGLHVDLHNEQALDPWNPFTGGGTCRLLVTRDDAALFRTELNKRSDLSTETELTTTLDRDDTTVAVKATANFAAAGDIHIGTECIGYASKGGGGLTFETCVRGKYPAFEAVDSGSGRGWANHHSASLNPMGIARVTKVSAAPRVWIGRWVGVWLHTCSAAGVLNGRQDAQLVFAGRIRGVKEMIVNGALCSVLDLEHVNDIVSRALIGRDMWTAKIPEGIYLDDWMSFSMFDTPNWGTTTIGIATSLTVKVGGGATPPYEVNPGFYTVDQLYGILNAWLAQALDDGDIFGVYSVLPGPSPVGFRTKIHWKITGSGPVVKFGLGMPGIVAKLLGFRDTNISDVTGISIEKEGDNNTDYILDGDFPPLRFVFFQPANETFQIRVEEERGTFSDQSTSLPAVLAPTVVGDWGVFLVDSKFFVVGRKSGATLDQCYLADFKYGTKKLADPTLATQAYTTDGAISLHIKQIYAFEFVYQDWWRFFLFSTGTDGYNDPVYDKLPYGVGIAIPGELIYESNDTFSQLPDANGKMVTLITEPIKLADLVAGETVLRHVFTRWKNGQFELRAWVAPSAANAIATLDENTKASPVENVDDQITTMNEDAQWAKPIVKIDFNRDITASDDDDFRDTITFIDPVAYEDAGGDGEPRTLQARNTYSEFAGTGASIEELAPGFAALMPLFSRPFRAITRTIDLARFESLSIGDTVLVSDEHACSPETGLPGLAAVPAVVIRISYSPGGRMPNAEQPNPMFGEVDLLVGDSDRTAAYAPAAQVDDTAANGGLDAGSSTIFTCYAHACSEASEAADASYFAAASKIRIVEIDPASAAAPVAWSRTVLSQTGNTITLTAAIAAPAWDATKKYRIIPADFTTSIAAQQVKCYQADDADALIQNSRVPFVYGITIPDALVDVTANATTDQVELPPDESYGDGKPLDIGHEMALLRLANNLIDYKTAQSSPTLGEVQSGSGATGSFKLTSIRPLFLGSEILSNSCTRYLTVAPWIRSSDGTLATVRVSITNKLPFDDTLDDITLAPNTVSVDFTSSISTWATAASQTIDLRTVKGFDGTTFLVIQCSLKAETRGLALCQKGPRSPS